ncbi:DUF4397 domain-containing protein [Halobiforma nitratireducens]|uniref:DUF4397 domain-containing protein n=1 Tax=Halobiforma nitratireducens JCM 10879 TaxID=1227454 RepID=M0LWK0_9EURY|nr:DUF4397 domain-containing protein [Halobiforma nitratireducens]EMA37851.1 hypothetical protein C446_10510 [Halobiforma nitratireducens JCM 10879]
MPVSRRTAIKTIGFTGGLTVASGTAFAMGEHEDDDYRPEEPADAAYVRVAHFSPDAPNVDVYVDDEPVLEDVAYGAISPYLELEPGTYTVAITAAGDPDAVVFEDDVTVEAGFYTVAAIGELEAETFRPEILVDADPLPEDGPDAAYVRVAHFSPDAPAVDVWADDAPLVENVSFEDVSGYLAVPAGTYTLAIRPAGDPETDVATFDVDLEAGAVYTGYAIGYLEPPRDVTDRDFTVELAVDGPPTVDEDVPAEESKEKADDGTEYDTKDDEKMDDGSKYDDEKADHEPAEKKKNGYHEEGDEKAAYEHDGKDDRKADDAC